MNLKRISRLKKIYFVLLLFSSLNWSCKNKTPLYEACKTSVTPIIDGKIDSLWYKVKSEPIINNIVGIEYLKVRDKNDLSATFKMIWDDDNIYILLNVTDDFRFNASSYLSFQPWECDEVEMYLDMQNHKEQKFDPQEDFKYEFVYSKKNVSSFCFSPTQDIEFVHTDKKDGYIMEIKIPFKTLHFKPYQNCVIGCEMILFDNDQDLSSGIYTKPIVSTMAWAEKGNATNAWKNASVYGNLKLINKK